VNRAQTLTVFLFLQKGTRAVRLRGQITDSADAALAAAAASAAAHPRHYAFPAVTLKLVTVTV
jgi:hypothetical protein